MNDDVTIVVVDDDEVIRMFIESSLDRLSTAITSFGDCWSAWMHIKGNCPDLVISDVHMGGMNGFDLLQSIRRVHPQTKCVIISADFSSKIRAKELGANAFLSKPFKVSDLIDVVRDLCPTCDK